MLGEIVSIIIGINDSISVIRLRIIVVWDVVT